MKTHSFIVAVATLMLLIFAQAAFAEFYTTTLPNAWVDTGPGGFTVGAKGNATSGRTGVPALDRDQGGCITTSMGHFTPTSFSVQVEGETSDTDAINTNIRFLVKASVYSNDAWEGTMDPSAAGANTDCTALDRPYDCCTGAGTGSSTGLCAVGTVQSLTSPTVDLVNTGGRPNTRRVSNYSSPVSVMNVGTNTNCSGTTCNELALRVCISRTSVGVANELPSGAKFLVTKINISD